MFRIFIDYGSEGWSLQEKKFETLDEAVKYAAGNNYGSPFMVVKEVEWEAVYVEKTDHKDGETK